MQAYPKPVIVVSKCLEFAACRYDGRMDSSTVVRGLKPYVEFVPICPEMAIDLGVPRAPINIYRTADGQQLFQPETELDLTEKMQQLAIKFLRSLKNVDGFILKSRSPSCGIGDVKLRGSVADPQVVGRVNGIFAQQVLNMFPDLPVESEVSLEDADKRGEFLTQVFARAQKRKYITVKKAPTS